VIVTVRLGAVLDTVVLNAPEEGLMAMPPTGVGDCGVEFVTTKRGARLVSPIIPLATELANDAVLALTAVLAVNAKGTLISCCRGRISSGEGIGVPLEETTVTPRKQFDPLKA
jgi:hypothetical protein